MSDCSNHHPNAPGATFCTTCGVAMGPVFSSPSVENLVNPSPNSSGAAIPFPPLTPSPPPKTNVGVIAGSVGGVAVLGLVAFLTIGGLGGPRIDVESPRSILMDARDFDFDMVNDSDSAGFLDGDYRFLAQIAHRIFVFSLCLGARG